MHLIRWLGIIIIIRLTHCESMIHVACTMLWCLRHEQEPHAQVSPPPLRFWHTKHTRTRQNNKFFRAEN